MSLSFAVGLMIGSAVIIFGRDTPLGEKALIALHLRLALIRRWFSRRR